MKPHAGRVLLVAAAVLCPALLAPAAAQQAQLRVVVVAGQDALNNIRLPENRDVIIEVQDQNRMPVMGAEVTFILPDQGPSGTFPSGMRSLVVTTDAQGQAVARGMRPNDQTGPMQIRVAATYLGQTATAVITQTNVTMPVPETPKPAPVPPKEAPPPQSAKVTTPDAPSPQSGRGMSRGAKVLLVLAIAAGAAAGAVLATRDGDSNGPGSPGTPPIVITPGTPTVGGPQ